MATVAQLRVLVADPPTPTGRQIFDDDHYGVISSMETNLYRAAANAARTLAAYFAQKVSVTAGPVKIESSDKCEHYLEMAKQYDDAAKTSGYIEPGSDPLIPLSVIGAPVNGGVLTGVSIGDIDDVNDDSDRYGSVFHRGLDDPLLSDYGDE